MELENCINYLLSVSRNTVFKQFSNELSEFDITPAQYGVLNCLWKENNISPKQIGDILHLGGSTVSTILDKMQKKGLIDRTIDSNNRRKILVSTTEKSMNIKTSVKKKVEEMNQNILSELSEEERVCLSSALLKIIDSKVTK